MPGGSRPVPPRPSAGASNKPATGSRPTAGSPRRNRSGTCSTCATGRWPACPPTPAARPVVTGELRELIGRERMEAELATLSGHLIVCGYGRMGKIVCEELERQRKRFVTIDRDAGELADWPFVYGLKVNGDATDDGV